MSITDQALRDARLGFSSANDYWAAELLSSLNRDRPGTALEWAEACVSISIAAAGDDREYERELLHSALSCNNAEELRYFSGKVEQSQRDELSLANLIVAKTCNLNAETDRSLFFLNAVMRFLGIYYRNQHVLPDAFFQSLPLGPL
jgi:hypothetical protein